ncbi:MAG: LacI family DNA-binding transcriptional regulator [Clostridia bacterium]|nr:LacI family DNA-binding transcriptional regulator [Clostridia bacterium]
MSTIKEVAERAGVSVTTVSRTLNNRGYISQSMRERIQRAMDELNYQPNEIARSLSFQHTRMIGVLVPDSVNPFFSEVIDYLARNLTVRGYKMLLYVASGTGDTAPDYVAMLRSNQVDGIIVALRSQLIESEIRDLPVVSFETLQTGRIPTVLCDNLQGGRLAAQELLDTGCIHPLMVGGRHATQNIPAFERFNGYREAIAAAGLEPRVHEINEDEWERDYRIPAHQALEHYPDTDGIFCTSDVIASYVMQEVLRLGKRVPEDVRIVGFNDVQLPYLSAIPMTSVHQPLDRMCATAVDCLLAQINGEEYHSDLLFPVELTRRASTRGYHDEVLP